MASPIGLGGAGLGLTAIGGLIGGFGAKESGDANAAAYQYKAGVALMNSKINKQNAAWATQSGGIQDEEEGLKAGQEIAGTKVAQSGSGFDVNSGSNASVRATQTKVSQFNEGVTAWDAARAAYGYEAKAAGNVAESNLDTMAADQSKKAGTIGMISSFLNAGGSVASKWQQGSTAGMFS
jgi:hypothetical protein